MPNLNWPLRKVVEVTRDWTGASVAKLECGHGWSEAAAFKWPKRTRCPKCAGEREREMKDRPKEVQYDFDNQAWIVNGVYQDCAHPASMAAQCEDICYGRTHKGEKAPNIH